MKKHGLLCALPLALALLAACVPSTDGPVTTSLASSQPSASAQPAATSEPDRSSMPAWAQGVALLEPDSFREDGKMELDYFYMVRWTEQNVEEAQQALLAGRQPEELEDAEKFNYTLLEYYRFSWSAGMPLEGRWEPLCEGSIGETLEIDLNGDAKADTLLVEKDKQGAPETLITINDVSRSLDFGTSAYYVIDIDPSDPYLEIWLYSELECYFVSYDGEQIIDMMENCNLPLIGRGIFSSVDEEPYTSRMYCFNPRITITPEGRIQIHSTSSMVMTYSLIQEYRLTGEHRLEAIPVDLYEMDVPLFVLDPSFAVYSEPNLEAERLPLDDYCIIWVTGTDAARWVRIQMPDGQTGWIHTQHGNIYNGEGEYGRYLFYTSFAG